MSIEPLYQFRESSDLLDIVRQSCTSAVPAQGHAALLNNLHHSIPDYHFQHVLVRGGWYRPGGIIDSTGKRITGNMEAWVQQQSGGEFQDFLDRYIDQDLYATRFYGKTHYLVAKTGGRACDFLQLEVEEVQERADRPLINPDDLPDNLEELIDPFEYEMTDVHDLSGPRYIFRRITSVPELLDRLHERYEEKYRFERFMDAWDNSSASENASFFEHWVLSLREYTDSYDQPDISVKPVSTFKGKTPVLDESPIPRGAELAVRIRSFDHDIGYPMAWFFYMLTHRTVSHQIVESIHQDLMGAYDYLPAKDLAILIDWYDNPYSF